VIERSTANTRMGLQKELDQAASELRSADPTISLISGTELFLRFVTQSSDGNDGGHGFEQHVQLLVMRARKFLSRAEKSRESIARVMVDRILRDDLTILVHGNERGKMLFFAHTNVFFSKNRPVSCCS
jgi:translation initiation factor 2B subunit (eIF-2B alpha/beta/delta family)